MDDISALLARIEDEDIKSIDLRFTDLAGRWRQRSFEPGPHVAHWLKDGVFINGSAVPGWRDIHDSDLLIRPDLSTALLDPFTAQRTLVLLCEGVDARMDTAYERDPRACARRAEAMLAERDVADTVRFAVELGFFMFDEVRIEHAPTRRGYEILSSECDEAGQRGKYT